MSMSLPVTVCPVTTLRSVLMHYYIYIHSQKGAYVCALGYFDIDIEWIGV